MCDRRVLVPCRCLIQGMNPFIPRSMREVAARDSLEGQAILVVNELRSMLSIRTPSPSLSEQVP